jgi:hypothetical protein
MSENNLKGVCGRIKGGTQVGTQKCVGRSRKCGGNARMRHKPEQIEGNS